jgi:hypothetical protein
MDSFALNLKGKKYLQVLLHAVANLDGSVELLGRRIICAIVVVHDQFIRLISPRFPEIIYEIEQDVSQLIDDGVFSASLLDVLEKARVD